MSRFLFLISSVVLLVGASAFAAPLGSYPVEVKRVVDADTFDGVIQLPWGIGLRAMIRPSDYDAWETSRRRQTVTITNEELQRGKEATHAIILALASPARLYIVPAAPSGSRDRYGRVLGILWLERHGETVRLAEWMKERGYIRATVSGDASERTDPD